MPPPRRLSGGAGGVKLGQGGWGEEEDAFYGQCYKLFAARVIKYGCFQPGISAVFKCRALSGIPK